MSLHNNGLAHPHTSHKPEVGSRASAKFLTFCLNDEEYAIEILKVQEIIGMMHITSVPGMPRHIRGIINLRGQIIPVIDLRLRFECQPGIRDEKCIIVVRSNGVKTGLAVDKVSEVLNIFDDQVDAPPSLGPDMGAQFLLGIGKTDSGVKLILDIDRITRRESGEPAVPGTAP